MTGAPPFPQSPLDLRGELLLGGAWADVTSYAYQRAGTSAPVKITRGRPDESSQVNPAKCSWQLNNRDGRFSPRNPLSPYYGQLGRNTPVRWSVPSAAPYLRLEASGSANCADSAALAISGSIEMRIGLRLTDWQGCVLACKWDGGGCWAWGIDPQGQLFFGWYDSGGTYRVVWSSQPVPFSSGDFALAVTMDAATGTVTFYSGDTVDGTFTQIGDAASGTGGAASSVAVNHGSQLQVGWSYDFAPPQLYGRVYEFRLYDGIAMGHQVLDGLGQPVLDGLGDPVLDGSVPPVAADAVLAALAAGTTAWADGQGNAWSLGGGAEVSGRDYRFHGELSSQPPKWDVTGRDQWVAAQAAGPLRRLQQASDNAMSAMKRAVLSQSGALAPVAYWPMEEATGATRFGAALGSYPMTFTQAPAPSPSSDSTFTASASLPSLNGARMQGQVAPYEATGTWTVRFLLKVATSGDAGTLLRVVTAGGAIVYVGMEAGGGLRLIVYAPDGTEYSTVWGAFPGASTGVWCSVEAQPASGGGVQYSLVTLMPGAATGNELSLTVADETAGAGVVRLVQFAPQAGFSSTVVGHCTVQSAWSSLFTLGQPLNAWTGELAASRYARLAAENGYACRVIGLPAYSAVMGPQGQATLTALLQECEAADLGMAFEPRQVLALGYRTLASMLNQPAALFLDYAQSQPGGASGNGSDSGLDPTYDDQLSKNDWTLTRGAASGSQGGTWQAQLDDGSPMSIGEPPDGIGDYASTQTVNVETDAQLPDVAGWMVHEGTVDEARWPAIPVNLARPEVAALRDAVTGVDCGDHVTLVNAPDQVLYDPVEQLAYGFTEQLGGYHWTVSCNCVPEDAFEVAAFDDPVRGRCDTDGSALVAAVSATATTLDVATTGPSAIPWTTDPADCPFDVAVAGERVTVTGVATSTVPMARVGATLDTAAMGAADFNAANAAWAALTGRSVPVTRVYLPAGTFTYTAAMQQMVAAGVKMCISFRPAFSPVSAADLTAMTTLLQALQTAGAECDIDLWAEPFYNGLSASQFQAAVKYYGPVIRQYYPLVFCTNAYSAANNGETSYYPGGQWFDKLATDWYCNAWASGAVLDDTANLDPGKPFGLWELGSSTDPTNGQTQAQVNGYVSYTAAWLRARTAAGRLNADLIWFNSGSYNVLPAADSTFESGSPDYSGSNATVAASPAQAHTGARSMSITATAAGTAAADGLSYFPVTAGTTYSLSAWLRAAVTARTVQVGVNWYTAAGAYVSSSAFAAVTDSATAWDQVPLAATAPATAAKAQIIIQALAAAAGEVHYADDVLFMPQDETVTVIGTGFGSSPSSDYRIASFQSLAADFDGTGFPQAMTVTRAVNGVAKPQAAGADVRLWSTPVYSLA